MSFLCVENISLTINGPILTEVSLELEQGKRLVLLGPSGSGKTSLLRCLNRLETPCKGRIFFGGKDIRFIPTTQLRNQIGMVFQNPALTPGTPLENVAAGPTLKYKEIEKDEIADFLNQVGLTENLWKRDVETLSAGERQRVAFAQVLANRPEVLLLDEPTSALDVASVAKLEQLIHTLPENCGTSIILVTHNIEQARRFSDLTLVLIDGKIIARGSLDEMMNLGDSALKTFFNREKKHEN